MFSKALLFAGLVVAAFAADAKIKSSGDDMMITADGTITMQADGGTTLKVSPTDITMIPSGDNTQSKTVADIANDLTALSTSNANLATMLADLKQNYTAMTTDLASMQSAYATTNKNYTTVLNDLMTKISAFKSGTVADVRTQYESAKASFNSSADGNTNVVGSLISRFDALKQTRDFTRSSAEAQINAAAAMAQAVLNNATSDANTFTSMATQTATTGQNKLDMATKVLTDGVADANAAIATGNTAVTAAAKSITDLATEINSKLGPKIAGITSATMTLSASVTGLMTDLDSSFFKLETSVQNLRAIINDDFDKYEEVRYIPKDVDVTDYFGQTTDWTGDTVIAGATNFNGLTGSASYRPGGAFIFTYNVTSKNFTTDAILEGERTGDSFGADVAIDGDTAVVGAPFWEPVRVVGQPTRFSTGAAYVYKKKADGTWMKAQTLTAPDASSYDYFGRAVSIDGNRMVVSAPFHEVPAQAGSTSTFSTGLIYVFERVNSDSDFTFRQALQAPDAKSYDYLGNQATSLVLRGNYIAAGASSAETTTTKYSHGIVYTWTLKSLPGADGTLATSWQPDGTLTGDFLDAYDYFGASVHMCIRNNQPFIAVGSYGDDGANASAISSSTGAVYVYTRTTAGYGSPTVLREENEATALSFGIDVAFNEGCTSLAVGANANSYNGAAYTYNVLPNGAASYVGMVTHSSTGTFDYGGRGLVWGSDFVGYGAYLADIQGSSSGAFYAMSFVDIV